MTTAAPPTWTAADLWQHIYGDTPGLIAAFSGKREPGEQELTGERSRYFRWPEQAGAAEQWLRAESDRGRCAYVCAHLINEPTDEEKAQGIKPRRIKANAAMMLALYVDGDGARVPNTLPKPSAVVQSSPGRDQAYWQLTHAIDPARGEQLNKRLAYAMGADTSGWDRTQLLRAPGTRNHKYGDRPVVRVTAIEDCAYDPDELERILPPLPATLTKERPAIKIEPTAGPIGDRDRRALEKMRASKRGAEIAMLEAGGSKFSKPDGSPDGNRDDLSMLSGYAFWFDKDPGRMARAAEQTARVRPKWYERHYASGETYLEHSIGQAIAGCSQSFREMAGYDAGDEPPSIGRIQFTRLIESDDDQAEDTIPGDPTTLEEAMIEIRRLRRRALDQDDKIEQLAGLEEDRQNVIRAQRERLDILERYKEHIQDVVTRDETECPSDDKVVLIGFVPWLMTDRAKKLANGESPAFALGYGAKVIGMHKKRFSDVLARWSSKDPSTGAPWHKHVTRAKVTKDDGTEEWESVLTVTPWRETPQEVLRASMAYVPPPKPKKGGSEEATAHRWRRCKEHPNAPVTIRGRCSKGGEFLGEARISAQDFEALKSRFVLSDEETPPTVVDRYLSRGGNGISDDLRPASGLKVQPVDSAPPRSLLDYAAERPKPWRCHCGSLERSSRLGGGYRCDGCGAVGGAFIPSSEWQDLPDGYPCPPGVEWRTNLATGTSQVRWPDLAAVAGGSDE